VPGRGPVRALLSLVDATGCRPADAG
jgi:hypothetical protein